MDWWDYTPKVGDECWMWVGEMNLPIPVTIVERYENPRWAEIMALYPDRNEDDDRMFLIRRHKFHNKIRKANGTLPWYPVEDDALFDTKDEAKKRCRCWLQAGIDWERREPGPDSKRHIESKKRRLRALEAL